MYPQGQRGGGQCHPDRCIAARRKRPVERRAQIVDLAPVIAQPFGRGPPLPFGFGPLEDGSASPTVIDTTLVPLSAQGNAEFAGSFSSSTAGCSPTDVAFLIRVSAGAWIGNGSVRLP
jgi:hypothetical protein